MTTRDKLEAFLEELDKDVRSGLYSKEEARELEVEARCEFIKIGRDWMD